jgi:hypothetical protein
MRSTKPEVVKHQTLRNDHVEMFKANKYVALNEFAILDSRMSFIECHSDVEYKIEVLVLDNTLL